MFPSCDGTSKLSVNSMAFAFASIGTWIDPFAAFTLAIAFAIAFAFTFASRRTRVC